MSEHILWETIKEQNEKIAVLKTENKLLGKRCNQLLKDKGDLTDKLQELKETLAQTIENDEVAYETLKLHDQEEIGMLNRKVAELENKIADIKANCDLAIEGRDIKIKELEKGCEETQELLDKQIEATYKLDKKNAELELELTVEKDQHQEEINLHLHAEDYIKSLEQQVEKMKCCENCKFKDCDKSNSYQSCWYCTNKDKWKLGR